MGCREQLTLILGSALVASPVNLLSLQFAPKKVKQIHNSVTALPLSHSVIP